LPLSLEDDDTHRYASEVSKIISPLEAALLQWNGLLSPKSNVHSTASTFGKYNTTSKMPIKETKDALEHSLGWEYMDRAWSYGATNQNDRGLDQLSTRSISSMRSTIPTSHGCFGPQSANVGKQERHDPVLEKIENVEDFETEVEGLGIGRNTPWTKMLLLEELGTASSWTLLLLPYVAFILSICLDAFPTFFLTVVGPLQATVSCPIPWSNLAAQDISWLNFPKSMPCCFPSIVQPANHEYQLHYHTPMQYGWAFVSGPIRHVPPMSVFLRGDSVYESIPTDLVAAVAQGYVLFSIRLFQHDGQLKQDQGTLLSASEPMPLTLHCTADTKVAMPDSLWNCISPRIVDVLFSLPGTGILSGEDLQVVVLYSFRTPYSFHNRKLGTARIEDFADFAEDDTAMENLDASYVFSDTPGAESLFLHTLTNLTMDGLERILKSSWYTLEHSSELHAKISSIVRTGALILTVAFLTFWCKALGVNYGYFFKKYSISMLSHSTLRYEGTLEESQSITAAHSFTGAHKFWWESPWIVFPERRYLLALLFCLILIQNPLLIYAYFHPSLYEARRLHAAADCIIGIGVFGIFLILHCLFHGLRYHTAGVSRLRAKQLHRFIELRRAAKFMVKSEGLNPETEESQISKYMQDHFETFGDAYGSDFSAIDTRLRHDPCGDDWPDFLLPKLLIFSCSVVCVITASLYRFPVSNAAPFSEKKSRRYYTVYISSSFLQLGIAFIWMIMIARQASKTGWMLRKEPFLSTRPAQLAYRIYISILLLGFIAFLVPIVVDSCLLLRKWTSDESHDVGNDVMSDDYLKDEDPSIREVLLQVLTKISERFPYNGTASSIGPGKILYITVCSLTAAFIFLPSSEISARKSRNLGAGLSAFSSFALANKRDKRLIVSLARYTHTWRIFPLPIRKVSMASGWLSEIPFQIGPSERSVAYFGRYTPVFCLEIACWLLEASWQAYYSPPDVPFDNREIPLMVLESIGLQMERCITDKSTESLVFVASNLFSQIDGEEDSIIVVSFRGTANTTNMSIDLKWGQVPLLDQIIGLDEFPMFQISEKGVHMNDSGDWFWDSPYTREAILKSFSRVQNSDGCFTVTCGSERKHSASSFSLGAKAIVAATPVTRQALPCVHEGFLEAYSHLRKELMTCVVEVLQRQLKKALAKSYENGTSMSLPKIYITGHSLGGSLGQLFALDIASNCIIDIPSDTVRTDKFQSFDGDKYHEPVNDNCTMHEDTVSSKDIFFSPFDDLKWFHKDDSSVSNQLRLLKLQPPIAVYTFGQPRVGNHAFSRLYKQRVPHTFRVVNEGDALTSLPNAVMLGGQYKHAGLEVILDEGCTGNIIVGPTVVETMFRFSKVRTSVTAHSLDGYRLNLESGFSNVELQEYHKSHGPSKISATRSYNNELPEWLTQMQKSNA
jgi:Lipase (class 3)